MRAIISRAKPDGSFHEVGTSDRTISKEYKTLKGLLKFATAYGHGKPTRVEVLDPINMYRPTIKTIFIT